MKTNRGRIWCLCCLTNCYNSAIIMFLIPAALLVCMKLLFAMFLAGFSAFVIMQKMSLCVIITCYERCSGLHRFLFCRYRFRFNQD